MSWLAKFLSVASRSTPALRTRQQMDVPAHWKATHFRAETADGSKIVYCPVGNICSWSAGDYDHRWCHWCQQFFGTKMDILLGPDEKDRALK